MREKLDSLDEAIIPLWACLKNGIGFVEGDKGSHIQGGPSKHTGSVCGECNRGLTLIMELDLLDPVFDESFRDSFKPTTRLPLYTCLQCMVAFYQVASDDELTPLPFNHRSSYLGEDESPFYDDESDDDIVLGQSSYALKPYPTEVARLFKIAYEKGWNELVDTEKEVLNSHFGPYLTNRININLSQIGGHLCLPQGPDEGVVCPNSNCAASKIEYPYNSKESKFLMRELAVIATQDIPDLEDHFFSIIFWICGQCKSITSEYQCT